MEKVAVPTSPDEEKMAAVAAAEVREEQKEGAPVALKKGPWTAAEDAMLMDYVRQHGEGNWNSVHKVTGLLRCGKSCRLRWSNHLRPNLKKGSFSPDEEMLVAHLHAQLGNKWARMAAVLPGRTDNEIKNYWNTRAKRRERAGLPVYPPEVQLRHVLAKRRRHDDPSALAPPQASEAGIPGSAGYTSARPAPLELAPQQQFLAHAAPFSAPSSPWTKSFAGNAHYFQLAHSSPLSPSTPTGPLQPIRRDLSCGYGQSRLPPLSPSHGPRTELPSIPYDQTCMRPSSADLLVDGGLPEDEPNSESLGKILREFHEAIEIDPPVLVPAANGGAESKGDAVLEPHGGREEKPEGEVRDDIDNLFEFVMPPFMTAVPAPNHSGPTSQQSGDEEGPSNVVVDAVVNLQAAGSAASSSHQEWSLDGVCQWTTNMSRIC